MLVQSLAGCQFGPGDPLPSEGLGLHGGAQAAAFLLLGAAQRLVGGVDLALAIPHAGVNPVQRQQLVVATALDDDALPPGCECKPGAVLGCATDEDVLECGADCHTPTPRTCIDELKGNVTKCVLPGGCLQCLTGDRRCSPTDGQQVQECDDKGFWQNTKVCDSNLGQTCAAGTCGTQCDKNVKANSYIGCSFWGADLDNAFVPGGSGRAYFDASNAQFAIVVANPKSSMTAATVKISNNETDKIFDSEGQPLDTSPIQPGELRVFNLDRKSTRLNSSH